MTGRRRISGKNAGRDNIEINVTGNQNAVGTHGGRAMISISQAVQDDWKAWRDEMEGKIKALKDMIPEDKSLLIQNVEQVVKEAEKGKEANPGRIERLLNMISTMAPDILEVIVSTLGNPLAGVGMVIKKVGEKAKVSRNP